MRMDHEAMRTALTNVVGRPPTSAGGWVYLPGQASRESRLLDAGRRLFDALDCYRGSRDPVTEAALRAWVEATGDVK
jgi:hypothetical protein